MGKSDVLSDIGKMFGGMTNEAKTAALRTAKNVKSSGNPIKRLDNSILNKSIDVGNRVRIIGQEYGVSGDTTRLFSSAASSAVYYGAYGAIGAGTVGAAVGLADREKTMIGGAAGGALSGAGLGAVAGAGVSAATVASAIAKSAR